MHGEANNLLDIVSIFLIMNFLYKMNFFQHERCSQHAISNQQPTEDGWGLTILYCIFNPYKWQTCMLYGQQGPNMEPNSPQHMLAMSISQFTTTCPLRIIHMFSTSHFQLHV